MRKVLAAAMSLVAIVSGSAVKATTLDYAFNMQNSNIKIATTTNAGNAISLSKTIAGSAALTMTATAWNATKSGSNYAIKQATLGQYVGGLGVTSAYDDLPGSSCGVGACGTHQIDNFGNTANSSSIDFVRLQFSQAVTLGSITRYAYGSYNAALTGVVYDDDFSYGKGGTIANNQTLSSSAFNALFGTNVGSTGQCSYKSAYGACVDTSTLTSLSAASDATASKTWFIASSLLGNYGGDGNVDSFKLSALDAYVAVPPAHNSTSPAPEPSSWAMMVLGFGAAGSVLRRQRSGLLRTA